MKKFIIFVLAVISAVPCIFGISGCKPNVTNSLKATSLGIGGGGFLTNPSISPFDENTMIVIPDMGGIYVSHNAGGRLEKKKSAWTCAKSIFRS